MAERKQERVESSQQAHDRGYRDAWEGKAPDPGYEADDSRVVVATRLLAYYTGYGDAEYAKRTDKLPPAGGWAQLGRGY